MEIVKLCKESFLGMHIQRYFGVVKHKDNFLDANSHHNAKLTDLIVNIFNNMLLGYMSFIKSIVFREGVDYFPMGELCSLVQIAKCSKTADHMS